MKYIKYIILVIVIAILFVVWIDKGTLIDIKAQHNLVDWQIVGKTPDYDNECPPQGLVIVNNKLIISNHSFDTKSTVYELDLDSLSVIRSFEMPDEAVHTGGLTYDGVFLYAVDYKSNVAYRIDYEESFNSGEANVVGSFDTTLKGTSACCIINDYEQLLLVISDFKNSRRTIIVDVDKAIEEGTAADSIRYTYKNEGYSQGLAYWDGKIYESENKANKSIINVYDFELIKSEDNAESAYINQFFAPDLGGQDLYINKDLVWISDAVTFNIYNGALNQ